MLEMPGCFFFCIKPPLRVEHSSVDDSVGEFFSAASLRITPGTSDICPGNRNVAAAIPQWQIPDGAWLRYDLSNAPHAAGLVRVAAKFSSCGEDFCLPQGVPASATVDRAEL